MKKLEIQKTLKTPEVKGDIEKGTFSIIGKSLPENSREFFNPILDWLEGFYVSPSKTIKVDIDLDYFNTSSSGVIFKLLKSFINMSPKYDVKITWHFEEDDIEIEEVGLEFQTMLGEKIELKERPFNTQASI